jgi:hypothetical protein
LTLNQFLDKFEERRRNGAGWMVHCSAHEDSNPSLSVSEKDGRILLHCHAGCSPESVTAALGVTMADLFVAAKTGRKRADGRGARRAVHGKRGPVVAEYVYRDAGGNPVARKLRFEPGSSGRKKDFAWDRWENGQWMNGLGNVNPPLYRLPEIQNSSWAVDTEGEKDADAGAGLGLPTTTSGGVNSWRSDHAESLRGKAVVVVNDGDDAGRTFAQEKAASLYGKAASVKVVEIPGSKDLAEAIGKGTPKDTLLALFEEAPEWKPAEGSELLDSALGFIRRFMSVSEPQARAVALWVAHTHAFDAAHCTPYLSVTSPEKESGKSRLLEVLGLLVAKPWKTDRASPAVLPRKIQGERPTLLLDESDAAFGGDKEYAEVLRGILNSGYRCDGAYSCCVGQGGNMSYKDFSTFCPKAIAGIGKLPDTVASRSIPIRLRRAKRGEVQRFRECDAKPEASEMAARLAAWCQANLEALRNARPEIPLELSDRQADVCEPLLAIADLAGGDWTEATRNALVGLCARARAEDDSIGVKLLADIRHIFYPHDDDGEPLPQLDRLASEDLVKALAAMEDRPWPEWGKSQKPISQPQLARLLGRYDIGPKTLRLPDGRRLKGYEREQFTEAWELYLLPDSPLPLLSPQSKA